MKSHYHCSPAPKANLLFTTWAFFPCILVVVLHPIAGTLYQEKQANREKLYCEYEAFSEFAIVKNMFRKGKKLSGAAEDEWDSSDEGEESGDERRGQVSAGV